ncbi:SET and MYND domain-containing protein [Haematococcus lacustris]|uniref:SET and MYND domain-containing protein n=1 Tax=Haematococcus lacustris TaxID=44745 RepID=A0A699YKC1_HAELA|nr:SET and MYND domain-containing protein [Haematococcus lacustris]
MYLAASLVNHSCEPNLDVVFPRNNSTLALRAARDISRGEQLTISYLDPEMHVAARQRQLHFAYGFTCQCQRCAEELQQVATPTRL